ncbi:MAG: adenylosuccinate lyase [Planctomycetes bacterium]|nr:adenylosuccinate lyase [Planctomycetota bacterium]
MSPPDRPTDVYTSPLVARYAGRRMLELFSERFRTVLWRRIWISLARAQGELGISMDREKLAALERRVSEIDFERIARYESRFRHDVMAHLHAFGDLVPEVKGALHLGATSMDVSDNADLVILKDALDLVLAKTGGVLSGLADFARRHRARAVLGRTHLQSAQPTTLGKRACLWLHDLVTDYSELRLLREGLKFRGVRGTTGTQDSFLALFDGDAAKVDELERRVAAAFGFLECYPVVGQTYPRKVDSRILAALAGLAQSAARFAGDIRILAMLGEVEEPIEDLQVGSSAMPYKRNPVRCERMNSLARHLIGLSTTAAWTAAEQRLERTLDDSAARRMVLPEGFLTADAILSLWGNIARGLVVHEGEIARALARELPRLATERILALAAKAGGDRQELHEVVRRHAREVAERERRGEGRPGELLDRLAADPAFAQVAGLVRTLVDPAALVGLAPAQVDRFLTREIDPLLASIPPVDPSEWELQI